MKRQEKEQKEQAEVQKKQFFFTKKGLQKMQEEHSALLDIRKRMAKGEAPEIFHSEDLNPEFLSYIENMELLDKKLFDLEIILKNAKIISLPPQNKRNAVGLGARVYLEIDGTKDCFEIVGSAEANPSTGKISNESPVGKALLGLKKGEEVIISSPIKTRYKIKKIEYPKE